MVIFEKNNNIYLVISTQLKKMSRIKVELDVFFQIGVKNTQILSNHHLDMRDACIRLSFLDAF